MFLVYLHSYQYKECFYKEIKIAQVSSHQYTYPDSRGLQDIVYDESYELHLFYTALNEYLK